MGWASDVGLGECNNVIKQTTYLRATGYGNCRIKYNAGRFQRMILTSYDPANSPIGSANAHLTSSTVYKTDGKNYFTQSGATDDIWGERQKLKVF